MNPPLKAASRCLRSVPPTTGPARTSPAAAGPGSTLPLCSTYCTGPRKIATVTTDPSAVRTWVTMTCATAAGDALALAGAAVAVRAGAAEAGRAGDGTAADVVVEDRLHAVVTHRQASAPATHIHPCLRPRSIPSSCLASMKQT